MNNSITYKLQIESIRGTFPTSLRDHKTYYSLKRALQGLRLMYLMNESLRERYDNHRIMIYLVHLEQGEQIARQRIFITNN